jgi:hypothetical protein
VKNGTNNNANNKNDADYIKKEMVLDNQSNAKKEGNNYQ